MGNVLCCSSDGRACTFFCVCLKTESLFFGDLSWLSSMPAEAGRVCLIWPRQWFYFKNWIRILKPGDSKYKFGFLVSSGKYEDPVKLLPKPVWFLEQFLPLREGDSEASLSPSCHYCQLPKSIPGSSPSLPWSLAFCIMGPLNACAIGPSVKLMGVYRIDGCTASNMDVHFRWILSLKCECLLHG